MITGSSPLARGLRASEPSVGAGAGIIPARAGFTRFRIVGYRPFLDHPRSRGVYQSGCCCAKSAGGSSPLARGLRVWDIDLDLKEGIIPARAGFTAEGPHTETPVWDHPRSRGVYPSGAPAPPAAPGSSPLARGLPHLRPGQRRNRRIIPARAGFTIAPVDRLTVARDHPRSRGVYRAAASALAAGLGSSPLARGLHRKRPHPAADHRIIPARAGFTAGYPAAYAASRDHPRSRGVYGHGECSRRVPGGSSPLARGLPRCSPLSGPVSWDHPRSRGVY